MKTHPLCLAVGVLMCTPALALAQDAPVVDETLRDRAAQGSETPEGWNIKLKLGASFSLVDSRSWVGSTEGSTFQIGGIAETNANYKRGPWEWDNTLAIQHQQTRTPQFDRFIKSTDNLDLISFLFYSFPDIDWVGAYLRLSLNTQVLDGDYVADGNVTLNRNGDLETLGLGESSRLTSSFEPLLLRQTVGVFANPIEDKEITVKIRAGLGAQETLTRDGFVVQDDEGTPEIDLVQLSSLNQLGAEADLSATGAIQEGVLSWQAGANVFVPFVSDNSDIDNDPNIELRAGLSAKLSSWLSLDYLFQGRRVPQVLDEWQVQNSLLLTAGFDLVSPKAPEGDS
ncbi:MAG: DUF3078 domain-containing protein [Myxococcota bacterium]